MKLHTFVLAALAAPFCPTVSSAQNPLTRVDRPNAPVPVRFDDEHLASELRAPELARRRAAYDSVLDWASTSAAARETVRRWADDTENIELAWTAELLLRELETTQRSFAGDPFSRLFPRRAPGADAQDESGDLFDRLRRSLESSFETDRFFGTDLGELLDRFGSSSSEGTSVQVGPEGVRVEVRSSENGDEQITTYEAESIEALLEMHPELEGKIGSWLTPGPLRSLSPDGRNIDRFPNTPFGFDDRPLEMKPARTRTDVLGVRVRGPEARSRSLDGVADDVGLTIVEIVPRTIADQMELEPGETIVAIDGREIRSVEDVRRALSARAKDAAIRVEVVTSDGSRRVRTWEPERARPLVF